MGDDLELPAKGIERAPDPDGSAVHKSCCVLAFQLADKLFQVRARRPAEFQRGQLRGLAVQALSLGRGRRVVLRAVGLSVERLAVCDFLDVGSQQIFSGLLQRL